MSMPSSPQQVCPTQSCGQNLTQTEQVASLAAGAALLGAGLFFRSGRGILATLAGGALLIRGISGYCPAYDLLGTHKPKGNGRGGVGAGRGVRCDVTMLINRPAKELYERWIKLETLPEFMTHLSSVTSLGENRSHWVARAPLGVEVSWDAEVIQQRPGELIAWQSLPGSLVDTAGSVHFREIPGRGSELRVSLKYDPPGGEWTDQLAHFFGGGIEDTLRDDLRRFKQLCETGEVPTTSGQTSGRQAARPNDAAVSAQPQDQEATR